MNASKIKAALAYVHHWEQNGQSRARAARDVIRAHALSSAEADILLSALHVAPSEVALSPCYVCAAGRKCAEHKNLTPGPPPVVPGWAVTAVSRGALPTLVDSPSPPAKRKTAADYENEGYRAKTWRLSSCPYARPHIRDAWQRGAWRWQEEQRAERGQACPAV